MTEGGGSDKTKERNRERDEKGSGLVDTLAFTWVNDRNPVANNQVTGDRQQLGFGYLRPCRAPYLPLGSRMWLIHGTSCGPQNSKLQGDKRWDKVVMREREMKI